MASDILIRPAAAVDIQQVRQILVETWHDTYDAIIGHDRVAEITGQWHAPELLAKQLQSPGTSFLVAAHESELVGHAFANSPQPPIVLLLRLYVLPRWQRRGIGSRLLDAVIQAYPGSTALRLSVEADNLKGVSFYRTHGFQLRREQVEEGLKVLRMEKMLA
jgi:ribosomal protein S18 acetylase RimI-like enzyme